MYLNYPGNLYRAAVTAYKSTIPILINNVDINNSMYPAINYRPYADRPYYSYVPIASFDKVGAKVLYDEQKNIIYVTTDYFQIQKDNEYYKYQLNLDSIYNAIKIIPKPNVPVEVLDVIMASENKDLSATMESTIILINNSEVGFEVLLSSTGWMDLSNVDGLKVGDIVNTIKIPKYTYFRDKTGIWHGGPNFRGGRMGMKFYEGESDPMDKHYYQ